MEIRPSSLDPDQRSHQRVLLHEQPRTGRAPKAQNAGTGIEGEVETRNAGKSPRLHWNTWTVNVVAGLSPRFWCLLSFAHVDAAVERRQVQVGAASIDRAVDIIIDTDSIPSALWARILNDRLGRRLHLHIKVAEYTPVVCTHFRVGFDALRQSDIDVSIVRSERHRLS